MKCNLFLFSGILFLILISERVYSQKIDVARYVDPYIGTGNHSHVFLGANVPFGAVQVGPDNYYNSKDSCRGYNYSDSIITGFSQMHLSGTDLGDVAIMPFTGELKNSPGNINDALSGYATIYSHKNEIVKPGYYSVNLPAYDEKVELTASERVAFHRYSFTLSQEAHIAIDLSRCVGINKPVKTYFKKVDDFTYTGYRYSVGRASEQRVYFAIMLSRKVDSLTLFNDDRPLTGVEAEGQKITAFLNFFTHVNEVVMLKIGLSPVSEVNALANIAVEIPYWDFEQVAANAYSFWNKELGKVEVISKYVNDLRNFYTSLYHTFTVPMLFNDYNGDYVGTDKKIYTDQEFQNYSVFSHWDHYHCIQPLFTLLQPQRVPDMINSLLAIYQQQGKLPFWPLMGYETNNTVGYSSVQVIADAYLKGFKGFDPQLAIDAIKSSSTLDENDNKLMKDKGFIPAEEENESVSKGMEYAISDWCIAQVLKKSGNMVDFEYYSKRAKAYTQYFDSITGFMRAKFANGSYRVPFDPVKVTKDYTMGNAWQYTWLVPQDVEGLIKLFGGEKAFNQKLDSLFLVNGNLVEDAHFDKSKSIGMYVPGNEICQHISYLHAYAGQQWETAEMVNYIITNFFHDKPDGLCGNEDWVQTSAWYVLSSIGFYPVNPCSSCFVFGTPLFDEVKISVSKDKKFTLTVLNPNPKNIYINNLLLNGKPYNYSFITYGEIMKGGTLEFIMSDKPNKNFGAAVKYRPQWKVYEDSIKK